MSKQITSHAGRAKRKKPLNHGVFASLPTRRGSESVDFISGAKLQVHKTSKHTPRKEAQNWPETTFSESSDFSRFCPMASVAKQLQQ